MICFADSTAVTLAHPVHQQESGREEIVRFRSKGPLRRAVDTSDTWINEQLCCSELTGFRA
jgi:hypothetical protein